MTISIYKVVVLGLQLFFLAQPLQAFGAPISYHPTASSTSNSALFYQSGNLDTDIATSVLEGVAPAKAIKTTGLIRGKRATVPNIHSLDDLQQFLGEDDRLVAIKFYAPWCKSCQRLGQHFERLAVEMGDGVLNRQKVQGHIRCAQVEYGSATARLITDQLQVQSVPTLQLYSGLNKIWEMSGKTNIRDLRKQLTQLDDMDEQEIRSYAEGTDDGILQEAIEDSFFDSPDFLNEEW